MGMSKTLAIVQARQTSTRLPRKALLDLGGKPAIERVVDRLKMVRNLDGFALAIPDTPKNDALFEFVLSKGWPVFRGDEDDVLGRYVGTALTFDADPIVRVTGDEYALDPGVIESLIRMFQAGEHDFCSNNLSRSFPHGMDAEIFSRAALIAADECSQDPFEREHVSPYLTRHGDRFRLGNLSSPVDLSWIRLVLDYPEDHTFASALYMALGRKPFTTADVLWLLERRPDLQALHEKALRASGALPFRRAN